MKTPFFQSARGLLAEATLVVVLGLASSGFAAETAPHIVRLRAGADVDAVAKEFNLKPGHIYRRTLNGFAVAMDSAASERLKQDRRVLKVEAHTTASIVTLKPETDPAAFVKEFNLKPRFLYGAWKRPQRMRGNQFKGFSQSLDAATLERLDKDNRVLAVEPDGEVVFCSQTVPTGIIRMGLTNFSLARINGQDHRIDVDVAVLDSGIQLDHPDLNVYLPGSVSFANGSTNGSDWNGHGTHVAGIFGALDNDFGVVGVAPGVRLWSVQGIGLNDNAVGNVLAGLDYISQHTDQISVVNCSLTAQVADAGPFEALHQAVQSIVNQGVVFVASAGNTHSDLSADGEWNGNDIMFGAFAEVMAVSAMDPLQDTIWHRSNYSFGPHDPALVLSSGAAMDVAAPGVNIFSTWKDSGYRTNTGTSMASPHVAGLVALYIAANGRATNAEGVYRIRQAIVNGSLPQSKWQPGYNTNAYNPATGTFGCYCINDTDLNPEPLAMPSEAWNPPQIANARSIPEGFQFNFMTVSNYVYAAQYSDSLTASNQWDDLIVTNGTGDMVTIVDPSLGNVRIYRLGRTPLATTNLNWYGSGDRPWFSQTNVTHDGLAAFQSGGPLSPQDGYSSVLNATLTGPGVLTFWWKVSSAPNRVFLEFSIDDCVGCGLFDERISGLVDWQQRTWNIPPGNHFLHWSISHWDQPNTGSDAGWLSEVVFTSAHP